MLWGVVLLACLAITPLMWKYRWFRIAVFVAVPVVMMAMMFVMKVVSLMLRGVLFLMPTSRYAGVAPRGQYQDPWRFQ